MKKLLLIVLSLFSVLAMTACKDEENKEEVSELKGTIEVTPSDVTAKVTVDITDEKVIDKEEIKITVTKKDDAEATKEVTYVKGTVEYTIDGLTKETEYVVTLTGFGELENKVEEKEFTTLAVPAKIELNGSITSDADELEATKAVITVAFTNPEAITNETFEIVATEKDVTDATPVKVAFTKTELTKDLTLEAEKTYVISITVSGTLLENKLATIEVTTPAVA